MRVKTSDIDFRLLPVVFYLMLPGIFGTGCDTFSESRKDREVCSLILELSGAIPKDHKVPVRIYHKDDSEVGILKGSIERRGGFSMSFPKHSYELDLDVDFALCDLPADDDWILNANYIDKTFIRHVMSYELFSDMGSYNLASKSSFVTLYLNGTYQGLYVLMEKLDKSSLGLVGGDQAAMIFKEPHIFRENYDGVVPQKPHNFHQQTYPKIEEKNLSGFVEDIHRFILESSPADFESEIPKIFDMRNVVDWHLLLLISNNSDGILKNFYLYKKDRATPLRIAPWDYDHSFGRDGDNELNLDERPLKIERSILFRRLLEFDWYRSDLKNRWLELNEKEVLSEKGLKQRIHSTSKTVSKLVDRNFKLWPVNAGQYYDDNNFEEEIGVMLRFIELRHRRLDKYFSEL